MSEKIELKGVGGWLAFLIISLMVISPLFALGVTNGSFMQLESQYPRLAYYEGYLSAKQMVWVLVWAAIAAIIYSGYRLWKDLRAATIPFVISTLWIVPITVVVGEFFIWATHFPGNVGIFFFESLKSLVGNIVAAGVWTAYLKKSVRVKNTYLQTAKSPLTDATSYEIKINSQPASQTGTASAMGSAGYSEVYRRPNNGHTDLYTGSDPDVISKLDSLVNYGKRGPTIRQLMEELGPSSARDKLLESNLSKSVDELVSILSEAVQTLNSPTINVSDPELASAILGLWRGVKRYSPSKAAELLEIVALLKDDVDFNVLDAKFNEVHAFLERGITKKLSGEEAVKLIRACGGSAAIAYSSKTEYTIKWIDGKERNFYYEDLLEFIATTVVPYARSISIAL